MKERMYKTLEFDKILSMLSNHAVMDTTKQRIADANVSVNIKKVAVLQEETADSITLITKKGSPPIMCTEDVRLHVKRARRGGVLAPEDILAVGKLMESSRRLADYPELEPCPSLIQH